MELKHTELDRSGQQHLDTIQELQKKFNIIRNAYFHQLSTQIETIERALELREDDDFEIEPDAKLHFSDRVNV